MNRNLLIYLSLLLVSVVLATITYFSSVFSNPIIVFLSKYHVIVMLLLVMISIGFGYSLAESLRNKIIDEQKNRKELLKLVTQLLSSEDRIVIETLIDNNGLTKQSIIAKKEGMNRVKAHRTIKNLEKRGIIKTEREGKTVIVSLKNPSLLKIN